MEEHRASRGGGILKRKPHVARADQQAYQATSHEEITEQ